jgi:secreted Zn-dependent insulinase-like peptidase
MVISSESSTCGAHLTVSAGSNQELYDKYQGLAHLLEHILYNGDPSSNEKLSDIL